MALVPLTAFSQKAKAEKFAVGQFNINNMEFIQGIIAAAEELNSPLIFGVSEGAIRYMGIDFVVAMSEVASRQVKVPMALHLDHGSSFDIVMKCIRAGFSSVMFDGSHHPFEENIRLTKQVVEAAHAAGVSVEGELGSIAGVEDDLSVDEKDAMLANPKQAIQFWQETQVDMLALAVGTAHGMYKGEPHIHFDVIQEVAANIDVPVVLHGGSGVPDESIRKAIQAGVGKINVDTENRLAFTKAVRETLAAKPAEYDARKYLGPARDAVKEVVMQKMKLFGSVGKA